jgi:hypothetical protein
VVVDHHPPSDPSGGDASKLSDPLEAGLLRRWLADFRESSGKQVALYSGHAHTAAVNRTDGVLEVNSPSVGKQPYGAADRGGFFGWQLVGVQRDPERLRPGSPDPESLEWLRAEVRPVIDGIELSAPERLPAGTEAVVAATGITSEYGMRFPLRFPASVTWSGSGGMRIARDARGVGEAARARGTIAVLNLTTMKLDGVRSGRSRLSVASGGQEVGIDVEVTGGSEQPRRGWVRAGRAPEPVAAAEADATAFLCSLPI